VSLRQKIEQEIRERGPIPFSRYMELCLYDPELGYYSRNVEKFGKTGDFYTSSDVHAVFGRLLARQFEEMWRTLGSPGKIEILELGPGRGLFAQDVLDWSEKKLHGFFEALHYTLVESSPSLRARLEATFRERIAAGKVSALPRHADSDVNMPLNPTGEDARRSADTVAPSSPREVVAETRGTEKQDRKTEKHGGSEQQHEREGHGFSRAENLPLPMRALAPEVPVIVFANEFFDALPVEVLSEKGCLRVSTRDGRFVEEWAAPSAEELAFLDRCGVHPVDQGRTEVALLAQRRMEQLAASIERGFLIAIDYGYTREQQLAGRHFDTIMTYRQHAARPKPYEAPGEQDITAHVNFTALAATAEQHGMHVHKLLTQSQFLMGIGEATQFADAFEECRLPQERAKVALQLKHLVTPEGMGETFQVMVASKGVPPESLLSLSGLSFATR
jgi:SAM-dependent MidA family methyltransferase